MWFALLRIVGVVTSIASVSFLMPIAMAVIADEWNMLSAFITPMVLGIISSVFILRATRGAKKEEPLGVRAAFSSVAISWIVISLFGALPLYIGGVTESLTDAVFESISGFTTTGATVISGLDSLPKSMNLWRCQTHWMGGMGFIVLTVAILPVLGVGGFHLIKAEATGPEKGKVTPKIANTAKVLWSTYMLLTGAACLAFHYAGMSWFDAVCHALSTMGTGGISTHDAGIAYFNSPKIEWICIAFMFVSSLNFFTFFYLLTGRFREVFQRSETRAFLIIAAVVTMLIYLGNMSIEGGTFRDSLFYTVSILSTTGFVSDDYTKWAPLAQMALFFLFLIGGCAGSTAGGVKVVRWVVLAKSCYAEILRQLHPHGVFTLRIDGKPAREGIVGVVAAFVFLYFFIVFITSILGAVAGLDPWTSVSAAFATIGNIGPAFGTLGPMENFSSVAPWLKIWYSIVMIAGRLELYTIAIFFTRAFWIR